jgi:high-affinity iron transporter
MISDLFRRGPVAWWRGLLRIGLLLGGGAIIAALFWQGVTAAGVPDPTAPHLDPHAVILNTGLLVFREGLEAILVLSAITASFLGAHRRLRRPVAIGAALALLASLITWFVMVGIIDAINAPTLQVQAVTGVLAIIVLLVIMNWFFHKIYWTGWIAHHNQRKRRIQQHGATAPTFGLLLLGFSAMYREGFEVDLFLQSLRLQVGGAVVLQGVLVGLVFTTLVGVLTFVGHHKLPYKRMLVLTGVLLGGVLVVMVGESVQELQQAGWLTTTPVPLPLPGWMGVWFATFPNVEGLACQAAAALLVIGSYIAAQYLRVWRPRRRAEQAALRPTREPVG